VYEASGRASRMTMGREKERKKKRVACVVM
jgi:hypothetical protein